MRKKEDYIILENGEIVRVPMLTEEEKKKVETDLDGWIDSLE